MRKRGVSCMELLAMEMKAVGRYVARGLSFRCDDVYRRLTGIDRIISGVDCCEVCLCAPASHGVLR
jgi:hypothetical protein